MKNHITDWGQFRFSVIGGLLSRPPEPGKLGEEIEILASRRYRHPSQDKWVTFGASTIERWYYRALNTDDPVAALSRRIRSDAGQNKAMNVDLQSALQQQYKNYPHWSYQLHSDNLTALAEEKPELGDPPSYSTVRRRMKERGWLKKRSPKTPGQKRAAARLEQREVRSYEAAYAHALWHLDFHHGSRRVVDSKGNYHTAKALCIIDDCSRLCCHIQWYLDETAESLIHGLSQAFGKRGLPRSLMTDNGSAMLAGETVNGLAQLGIEHETILPYSAYQNGKQESFWGQLEGRMLAMLTAVKPLTLQFLNETTQAWVEMEYNRSHHEELGSSPLTRFLQGPEVSRPCPDSETVRQAFTARQTRKQRRSDGTLQLKGVRYEVPVRFKHLEQLSVRFRSWDLSSILLVDERTGNRLAEITPLDKRKNAEGRRRTLPADANTQSAAIPDEPIPALLRKIINDYAATGLPAGYLPKDEH